MRVYVRFYNISFEHEVKTVEMDLNPTVSSNDPPGMPLVLSLVFGPYNESALPGNPYSVWSCPPGKRYLPTPPKELNQLNP